MQLDIAPVYDEAYECFQCILVSVANYFGFEYELMFASSWGFELLPGNMHEPYCSFGPRLERSWEVSFVDLLNRYHGIAAVQKSVCTLADLQSLFEREMQKGMPVALFMDSFWCRWTLTYNKYHYNHSVLITKIDKQNERLYCIDPYYSSKVEQMTFKELEGKFDNCSIFEIGEPLQKNIKWHEVVAESLILLKYGSEYSMFGSIRKFADDIEKSLDIRLEVDGVDTLYAAPIFVQLKKIRSYRMTFAKTLMYLSKKYGVEELCISGTSMLNAGNMWSQLSMLLIKMAMSAQQEHHLLKKRAAGLIRDIADAEESIAHALIRTIRDFGGECNG